MDAHSHTPTYSLPHTLTHTLTHTLPHTQHVNKTRKREQTKCLAELRLGHGLESFISVDEGIAGVVHVCFLFVCLVACEMTVTKVTENEAGWGKRPREENKDT